ncbi:PREDICTED: cell wall integrity and stress response component 4-like [Cyprinodon variegatus]|uniref:cell wall integrity and stress response component 4-like n=1 Tax=Cyprinodon variegatus TaxID=28743 RepID=UPI000742B21C|nr:PREDICTED: cell wall integrity and stress response component 4-like [Cyprinodon variegatus]
MNGTQAEMGVEFNKTTPAEAVPKPEDVQEVLVVGVKNSSLTMSLNITFDPESVTAIRQPVTTVAPTTANSTVTPAPNTTISQNSTENITTTTAGNTSTTISTLGNTTTKNPETSASSNSTSNNTTTKKPETSAASNSTSNNTTTKKPETSAASNSTSNTTTTKKPETSAASNSTSNNTTTKKPETSAASNSTSISTTTTTTTVEQTVNRRLTFRSPGETFTTDLLDQSSSAFINRAALLKSILEPFYQQSFSSFRSLTVISFSNGSIINNMDLAFASASAPNGSQIANVLINAASNISAFTIDTSNILVDGEVSSGVSQKINLITALCMVLLSWVLSSQH